MPHVNNQLRTYLEKIDIYADILARTKDGVGRKTLGEHISSRQYPSGALRKLRESGLVAYDKTAGCYTATEAGKKTIARYEELQDKHQRKLAKINEGLARQIRDGAGRMKEPSVSGPIEQIDLSPIPAYLDDGYAKGLGPEL